MTRSAARSRGVVPALLLLCVMVVVGAGPATAAPSRPPAAPGPGGIGLRLVDAPLAARNDPRAWMYIVDHLAPATVIHRRVEVANTTTSAVDIVLYAAAAAITAGSFLGAAGLTPNDLSTWTTIAPATLRVPAGGRIPAVVSINVPRDAAPGEQYGVIWAEARSASLGAGIVQVNRVGVRLYLSVGPGGAPRPDFTIDSLTAIRTAEGRPAVIATVHNTGGRALDLNGTLHLADGPGGLNAGPFPATLGVTLAIGTTAPVAIVLDPRLPAGPWNARITLRSGLVERAAEATITFPDVGVAAPVRATPLRPGWLYPAAGLAALLLGLAALLVTLRYRRHADPIPSRPTRPRKDTHGLRPAPRPAKAPRPERRRGTREPVSRLGQSITVADIAETTYHWQLGLPGAHDRLTDLANRSLFEDEAQFVINSRGGNRLCLMLINLDNFDTITTTFGPGGADAVLVAIAERLRRAVRPQDLIARLDGDEFAILFEDVDRADVNAVARRMLRTIHEPLTIDGHELRIRASLGVTPTQPTDDAGLLIRHAAAALAKAKNASRAHYAWYAETT